MLEHNQGLLGNGCVTLQEPGVGKDPHRILSTGPPASTSISSAIKLEEDSSDGESPVSPPRDILPSMGLGE